MKNILIPTDFTVQSLQLVVNTAETLSDKELNIVLFHAFDTPSDIMDLMFLKRNPLYEGLMNESFRRECRRLKMKYGSVIGSITFRHFYGNTRPAFKNFIRANAISLVVWPKEYLMYTGYRHSINPERLIKTCGVEILSEFETENDMLLNSTFIYVKKGMESPINA
ncbi:hypothetical protein QTN47_13645 [Danxiaibacter flavus]|uniref:UspA domain-containing protein n=1 Tax=Danxiaibacter flavus TaxID=3049108 RepID=A0ABV3ZF92_9BACT|nr:hypothetical protein QNM32_13650 [Chitinophagaceae bacterium DXS]